MSEEGNIINVIEYHGKVILYDGRRYHTKKTYKNGNVLLRCTNWQKFKCSGYLTVNGTNVVKSLPHALPCQKNPDQNEVDLATHKCKGEVKKLDSRPIREIYDNCIDPLRNRGLDLVARVPSLKALKSALYGIKNKSADVAKIFCTKVCEVEIPKTHLDFVMCDYFDVHSSDKISPRVVIFCLDENRTKLSTIQHVFCDGTFKTCSPPFKQLYVMHGYIGSSLTSTNVVPLLYALLSDKTAETYDIFFKMIKSQVSDFNPKKFNIDMEIAVVKAIKENFHEADINICYFHVKKSIRKKGKQLNLIKNKYTRRVLDLCSAMALLPVNYMSEGWNYINKYTSSMSGDYPNILKLKTYMNFWLKNDDMKNMWSVFSERHRTNNCSESWNSIFFKMIGRQRPDIIQLLNALKRDAVQKRRQIKKTRRTNEIANDKFIQESQLELLNSEITVGQFLDIVR